MPQDALGLPPHPLSVGLLANQNGLCRLILIWVNVDFVIVVLGLIKPVRKQKKTKHVTGFLRFRNLGGTDSGSLMKL